MVPRQLLRDWALATFQAPTHYWTFRKQFTLQLSLAGFAEFVMHLTRLNPDMMYLHQDSGLMNLSYFKFDVDDISGDLDANRPVPFRLTPNLSEFMTSIGVAGPMTAGMIATARCIAQPSFKVQALLRAVLRDEMIAWHKKKQDDSLAPGSTPQDMEGELLIGMVSKAVSAVMTRLQTLATFDGADSKSAHWLPAANSHDNLCRMDPSLAPVAVICPLCWAPPHHTRSPPLHGCLPVLCGTVSHHVLIPVTNVIFPDIKARLPLLFCTVRLAHSASLLHNFQCDSSKSG
ncbi:hypothetical protein HPB48_006545 [Haemaphysalis longicornis]|uniref:PI3K/PI4K catalytic domain-containing protein n=1 Tax=Haemaphysalis longicornis TaxID=44386 RepID=A0A9J6GA90_HAELO|nr:hypothetical protein HPB48_006545 [Haemaphysalis longicornis]